MLTALPFTDVTAYALILLGAVFVHACFQLSVSVLTLLSSHTIGRRLSSAHLLQQSFAYIGGVIMTITLLQLAAIALHRFGMALYPTFTTVVTFSLIPVIALAVTVFYYRQGKGTQLWLPRPAAQFITDRAKKTHSRLEALSLGVITVLSELPFALAPLAIVALGFQEFSAHTWFTISLIYGLAVSLPLVFVALYLSSGHTVSSIQRWRENAKTFLQWMSALALVVLMLYITVQRMEAGA